MLILVFYVLKILRLQIFETIFNVPIQKIVLASTFPELNTE